MKELINKCKVIIFDLDGTLYEGTGHYDYYAQEISKEIREDIRERFFHEYERIKRGEHPLKVGTVYDMERDYILTYDPFLNKVTDVHTWEGQALYDEDGPLQYKDQIKLNEKDYIAIGDGWWFTYVLGVHHGVKDTYHCYNRTKEYMASDKFKIPFIKGLKEILEALKGEKTLILMTNSDREDVTRLLKNLDLENVFSEEITSAEKPMKVEQHLNNILQVYNVKPEEVVSIGDNFINEIAPALKLGLHGVYIAPQGSLYENDQLIVVPSLSNLVNQ